MRQARLRELQSTQNPSFAQGTSKFSRFEFGGVATFLTLFKASSTSPVIYCTQQPDHFPRPNVIALTRFPKRRY